MWIGRRFSSAERGRLTNCHVPARIELSQLWAFKRGLREPHDRLGNPTAATAGLSDSPVCDWGHPSNRKMEKTLLFLLVRMRAACPTCS